MTVTDLSTNGPTSWSWTFGDGGSSSQQNPSYTYTAAGTYTVSLTATNAFGSDTETKTAYITVTAPNTDPPVANFSGSPTSGFEPLTVDFTDLSSNNPTSWSWTFGDGGSSSQQNPSYTYTAAGTYTVSLTATNAYGSDTETKTGYITVSEQQAVVVHVADISVWRIPAGRNCTGRGTVTIVDASSAPVAGATVYVSVTGNTTESLSGVTGSDGTVTLTTLKTKNCGGEWCFEVSDVVVSGGSYNSSANVVTMACESGVVYSNNDRVVMWNAPNPFNPTTTIGFTLPHADQVNLSVYNIRGQKVTTVVDQHLGAGAHTFEWDGSNVASGVYFYRLTVGETASTKKMVLMK